MTLGQNIQNARRAQGLSQEALAEKIGVSRQALGKWEKDTALPGLDNLQALAAALGIGVDALLGVNFCTNEYIRYKQYKMERECNYR